MQIAKIYANLLSEMVQFQTHVLLMFKTGGGFYGENRVI